ncbi:tyrosine-protein phosphatase [Salinifilum ghardaiensis]
MNRLVNLRDVGGIPTGAGAVTRHGVLYRADAPYEADEAPDEVEEWPPSVVVDLRQPAELNGKPHPLAESCAVHSVPLIEDVHEGPTVAEDDGTRHELTVLYEGMLNDAPKKLVEVFRLVLEADGPGLIHCAAGKDRTGVSTAMLLSAAGARSDAIVADYARTDRNMFRVLQRLDAAPELPPGVDEEAVLELISTPTEAIEAVLEHFEAYPDGAAGWLREHGVTDAELSRWQERFTTEATDQEASWE